MKKRTLYAANFKGVSHFSELIRFQTDGKYSHTAVWLDDHAKEYIDGLLGMMGKDRTILDRSDLIEQWPHNGGFFDAWFDFNNLSGHSPGTEFDIWGLEMSVTDWEYCMNQYLQSLGEPYDWKGIAHFRIKSVKQNSSKSFCSEKFIEPVCKILGWDQVKPFNVHPDMVAQLIQVAGGRLIESREV